MPLVTRQSNQGNLWKEAATPNWATNDLWVDTDDAVVYVNNAGTAQRVGRTSFATSATISYSQTIGDYTTPSAVVATSAANASLTQNFDTAGTTNVVTFDTTNNRCGEKVTSTTTRSTPIVSMTMRLSSTAGATGTLNYVIRKTSDSSIVATSTQTLNAATLTSSQANYTLNFNSETLPNEDYYAVVEGIATGAIQVIGSLSDTSANGVVSYWSGAAWNDLARDARMSIVYTAASTPNAIDDNTSTVWTSNAEANPAIYVDCGGSSINLLGMAIYLHSSTTETQIAIRASTDTTFTSGENTRTINATGLTAGAWNYIRWNLVNRRYLQIYGNSGSSSVLAISEIKYLTKTDAQILQDLGILEISPTDTALALNGT